MKITILFFPFVLIILFTSCRKEDEVLVNPIGEGSLSLEIQIEKENTINARTSAVITDHFDVALLSVSKDTIFYWHNVTDVPETIKLKTGSYYVTVASDIPELPAFDAVYYRGTSEIFNIKDGENKTVEVITKLSNVKVTVTYSDSVKNDFYDYFVRITDAENNFLTFNKDEIRPGFFVEGNLTAYVKLFYITADQDSLFFEKTQIIEEANPNDHINIIVDANLHYGAGLIKVNTSESVNTKNVVISFDEETETTGRITQLTFHKDHVRDVSISPDRKVIYYTLSKLHPTTYQYIEELYAIQSDGSNQRKILTFDGLITSEVIVSNDLKKMAFIGESFSNEEGVKVELIIGNTDGSDIKPLIRYNNNLVVNAFFNQDQSILYNKRMRTDGCYCNTLWTINLDGTNDVKITGEENAGARDVSQDGKKILVDTNEKGYTIDINGNNLIELGQDFRPRMFSPYKSLIAGYKRYEFRNPVTGYIDLINQVFLVNEDGSNLHQITDYPGGAYPIDFTKDGQHILIASVMDHLGNMDNNTNRELYLLELDGNNLKRLTNNNFSETAYGFLESDTKILFTSYRDGFDNLYVFEYE